AEDLEYLFEQLPSPSNGVTLCTGTFGSRADNDVAQMAKTFGNRIYFAHLRGVRLDPAEQRSFTEVEHLESDLDMIRIVSNLLHEEKARAEDNRGPAEIFIRPDHGHQMMDDLGKKSNPGYSAIGRLKGLAEIRGAIYALQSGM
ncbi:MAG: mannonate dehydratase, partial [Kordiimonadaceae bacterium]|nr:mannonate dehydratase [Kordiimonadaceae bacterium]